MLPASMCWYATKGGVGKSTHTAHHAVLAASGDNRVLTVDLDHQGSLGRLLGYGHFTFESAAQAQGLRNIRFIGDPDERDLTIQRVVQRSGLRGRTIEQQLREGR